MSRFFKIAAARRVSALVFAVAFVALGLGLGTQVSAAMTVADASPAPVTTPPPKDTKAHYSITPYLWLPTIHGELNFNVPAGGNTFGLTVVPSQYVPKLGGAALFAASVQKGDWGAMTDLIYLNLSGMTSGVTTITGPGGNITIPINTNVMTVYKQTIWTAAATYNLAPNSPPQNFDGLLGFRYANVSPSASWNFSGPLGLFPISGSRSESASLWDGIVGVKGKFDIDKHWFAPFYGDIGTGSSNLTWQAYGGIGYGSRTGGSVVLVYRNLYYNMGNGKLLHNINMGGPLLGYTFRL